jgi:hypothetical protein
VMRSLRSTASRRPPANARRQLGGKQRQAALDARHTLQVTLDRAINEKVGRAHDGKYAVTREDVRRATAASKRHAELKAQFAAAGHPKLDKCAELGLSSKQLRLFRRLQKKPKGC